MRRASAPLALATLLLLLVAANRIFQLDIWDTRLSHDEVWSVWQSMGSLGDVVRRTPYDWPPGYYVMLWAWQNLVGIHPVPVRMLSVFAMLVGVAGMFRAGERLLDTRAGLLAAAAYAAFGYVIFLSIELRGYALALGLYPLIIWQTTRYFGGPTIKRALILALLLAALLYVTLTGAVAWALLGLFSLIVWGRSVWRWWLPAVLALVLFLPELVNKLSLAVRRIDALNDVPVAAESAIADLYEAYVGVGAEAWLVLFLIAALLYVLRGRKRGRTLVALSVWALMPLALYATHSLVGFFYPRYSWWVMPGLALWLGAGLALASWRFSLPLGAIMAALMFLPLPLTKYQIAPTWISRGFQQLSTLARAGDVVVVDPNCDCLAPMETDYYRQVYFPNGLRFADTPGDHARVWLISNWLRDEALADELASSWVHTLEYGPAQLRFGLYERPPDVAGVPYDNGIVFHGVSYPDYDGPFALREGQDLRVRLWWSLSRPVTRDYSVGLYLRASSGILQAQVDGPLADAVAGYASGWTPGQIYVEERVLTMPYPVRAGQYRLQLAVYTPEDGQRLSAPDLNSELLRNLGRIQIMAW